MISVIIPTYKPGDYIWECLQSLENQTLKKEKFEVIIVLNGCKEPYYDQLTKYISLSNLNIKLLYVQNAGVSNARNLALDYAKGDYISFIDDDDYVSNIYLEELLKIASPDTVAVSNIYAFNDGNDEEVKSSIADCFKEFNHLKITKFSYKHRRYFNGPCMKLIHKDIIRDVKFNTNFKNGEDCIFMLEISDKIKNIAFTNNNAIYFRRYREGSALMSKKTMWYMLKNSFKINLVYTRIFLKRPFSYSFWFYLTRIFATGKAFFVIFKRDVLHQNVNI